MKCRNFYIEVVMTIKYENKFFFSKSLSQIDVFSCPNFEYTTKNDRPVRSQKIWKIWLFKAYSAVVLNLGVMGHFGPRSKFWKKSRSQIWGCRKPPGAKFGVSKVPRSQIWEYRRHPRSQIWAAEGTSEPNFRAPNRRRFDYEPNFGHYKSGMHCFFFPGAGKNIKVKRKPGDKPRIFIFVLFLRKSVWKFFSFRDFSLHKLNDFFLIWTVSLKHFSARRAEQNRYNDCNHFFLHTK